MFQACITIKHIMPFRDYLFYKIKLTIAISLLSFCDLNVHRNSVSIVKCVVRAKHNERFSWALCFYT